MNFFVTNWRKKHNLDFLFDRIDRCATKGSILNSWHALNISQKNKSWFENFFISSILFNAQDQNNFTTMLNTKNVGSSDKVRMPDAQAALKNAKSKAATFIIFENFENIFCSKLQ